jgi:hypothetical protein
MVSMSLNSPLEQFYLGEGITVQKPPVNSTELLFLLCSPWSGVTGRTLCNGGMNDNCQCKYLLYWKTVLRIHGCLWWFDCEDPKWPLLPSRGKLEVNLSRGYNIRKNSSIIICNSRSCKPFQVKTIPRATPTIYKFQYCIMRRTGWRSRLSSTMARVLNIYMYV